MPSHKKNDKMFELIKAIQATRLETIPPDEGWFTTLELSKQLNCSVGHASKMILKGQMAGVIETRKFKLDRNGSPRAVPHFRKK